MKNNNDEKYIFIYFVYIFLTLCVKEQMKISIFDAS